MGQTMLENIKHNTRNGVRQILNDFPETRSDDRKLCVQFWKVIDKAAHLDDLQHATTPEAIRRARQWLNERGFYLSDDEEVLRRRRKSAISVQNGITKI
jgi:hypothetical protein